eukprot:CAMPEP_0170458114 /NCGR_PEP_ID=MMETSP0123-20130129/5183_1 /TAXON_ID=182087 /ORGANISM="Favella ehrenbergii, Strain Fehren 1" /LENGTH=62 /DNA_ID=CAMNT_0010722137 /DNA_START=1217 /DNA_END=1405 /DNA_ORIENTATION=+
MAHQRETFHELVGFLAAFENARTANHDLVHHHSQLFQVLPSILNFIYLEMLPDELPLVAILF